MLYFRNIGELMTQDAIARLIEEDAVAELTEASPPTIKLSLRIVGAAPRCWQCSEPVTAPGKLLVTPAVELIQETDRVLDRRQLLWICPFCDAILVRLEGEIAWQ